MISNFFVLSPRGDTILSKMYRVGSPNMVAHERTHTEAFLRKVKFWDGMTSMSGAAVTSSPEFISSSSSTKANPGSSSSSTTTSHTPIGTAVSIDGGGESIGGDESITTNAGTDTSLNMSSSSTSVTTHSISKKRDAPPIFLMPDGLNYLHIKRNGLIFACSSPTNVSPCTVIEVRFYEKNIFLKYIFNIKLKYPPFFKTKTHGFFCFSIFSSSFQLPFHFPTFIWSVVTYTYIQSIQRLLWYLDRRSDT